MDDDGLPCIGKIKCVPGDHFCCDCLNVIRDDLYYGCFIAPVEEGEVEPGGAAVRHQCVISISQESWRVNTL